MVKMEVLLPAMLLDTLRMGGAYFASDLGLPVTANPGIAGASGGVACYSRLTQVLQSS